MLSVPILMESHIKVVFLCGKMYRSIVLLASVLIVTVVIPVALDLYFTSVPEVTQYGTGPHERVDSVSFQIANSKRLVLYNLKKFQSEPRLVTRNVTLDTLRLIANAIGLELSIDQQIVGLVMHVRQRDAVVTATKPDSVLGASVFLYLTRDSNKPLLRLYEIDNGQWRPHTQFPEVVTRNDLDPTIVHHRELTQRQFDSTSYMVWLREP